MLSQAKFSNAEPLPAKVAIEDIDAFAGKGSALLNFAIVGGAVFPPVQGMIADNFSVHTSYLVPCGCFVVITIYAFFFTKKSLMTRKISQVNLKQTIE